jgi:predicted dehydrogenase
MYSPVSWRDFWDFGTAPIGDFFCHNFDPVLWSLDWREPLSIEACGVGGVDSYMADRLTEVLTSKACSWIVSP